MSSEPYALPRLALPHVLQLMRVFKNALEEQMQEFNISRNTQNLRRVVITLKNDLELFKNSFDYWHQNAEKPNDYQLLEQLARELGEAQNLICDAIDLTGS